MLIFEEGKDILASARYHTLVCPVNTVGVMGKGLARQFRYRYPECVPYYQRICRNGTLIKDHFGIYAVDSRTQILFMPTKRHWRYPSQLEWIETSLIQIASHYESHAITSLAIGAVGCGEGGLLWRDVLALLEEHLSPLPIPVGIYAPWE